MLQLFPYDVYCFFNLGSSLSYMASYAIIHFCFNPEYSLDYFFVSSQVGDFNMDRGVYWSCVIMFHSRETLVDLVELGMVFWGWIGCIRAIYHWIIGPIGSVSIF